MTPVNVQSDILQTITLEYLKLTGKDAVALNHTLHHSTVGLLITPSHFKEGRKIKSSPFLISNNRVGPTNDQKSIALHHEKNFDQIQVQVTCLLKPHYQKEISNPAGGEFVYSFGEGSEGKNAVSEANSAAAVLIKTLSPWTMPTILRPVRQKESVHTENVIEKSNGPESNSSKPRSPPILD